jgi:hypothetical protein
MLDQSNQNVLVRLCVPVLQDAAHGDSVLVLLVVFGVLVCVLFRVAVQRRGGKGSQLVKKLRRRKVRQMGSWRQGTKKDAESGRNGTKPSHAATPSTCSG